MDLKTPFNKKLFFFIIFNLFVCTQVEANDTTKVVDYMDADYPRDSIYKANYKMALPKWYSLDDHLKLKPKYLILVEQPLELNNKETKYKFIYNSAHNFFSLARREQNKGRSKIPGLPINFLKRKILVAPTIEDKEITLNQFIEKVFDHCRFTNMISAKDTNNKSLKMSKYKDCRISQINTIKFKAFTEKEYKQNKKDIGKFINNKSDLKLLKIKKNKPNIKNAAKNKTINAVNEKKVKKKTDTKLIDKNFLVSLKWARLEEFIIGQINFENKNSGKIKIKLNKSEDICIGTIALTNKIGTWSITCPDNKKRPAVFSKSLSASGTLRVIENSTLSGIGKDIFNNRIQFSANYLN